jgi:hypothetical protein
MGAAILFNFGPIRPGLFDGSVKAPQWRQVNAYPHFYVLKGL